MRYKLLIAFLLLVALFFGCKKGKPVVHEPDSLVKDVTDSLMLIHLEPKLAGLYLVSGAYTPEGPDTGKSCIMNHDTLSIVLSPYFAVSMSSYDCVEFVGLGNPFLPDYLGYFSDTSRYYGYYFSRRAWEYDNEWVYFPKNNIDSFYMVVDAFTGYLVLSGVKIH